MTLQLEFVIPSPPRHPLKKARPPSLAVSILERDHRLSLPHRQTQEARQLVPLLAVLMLEWIPVIPPHRHRLRKARLTPNSYFWQTSRTSSLTAHHLLPRIRQRRNSGMLARTTSPSRFWTLTIRLRPLRPYFTLRHHQRLRIEIGTSSMNSWPAWPRR